MKTIPSLAAKNNNVALSTQLCCLLHQSSLLGSSFQSAVTELLSRKTGISVLILACRNHLACVRR